MRRFRNCSETCWALSPESVHPNDAMNLWLLKCTIRNPTELMFSLEMGLQQALPVSWSVSPNFVVRRGMGTMPTSAENHLLCMRTRQTAKRQQSRGWC